MTKKFALIAVLMLLIGLGVAACTASAATITGSASGAYNDGVPGDPLVECSYSVGLGQLTYCPSPIGALSYAQADPYITFVRAQVSAICSDPLCHFIGGGTADASVSVSGDYRFFGGPIGQTGTILITTQCDITRDGASGRNILIFDGQTFGNTADCTSNTYMFDVVYGDTYSFSYQAAVHAISGGGNGGYADAFSSFDPSDGAVALPEPCSLFLLATGIVGVVRRVAEHGT